MKKMYRIVFLILLVAWSPFESNLAATPKFFVGTNFFSDSFDDFFSQPGWVVGGQFDWFQIKSLNVSAQPLLCLKKRVLFDKLLWSYPGVLTLNDLKLKVYYIEIPILVSYPFTRNMYLRCGPSLNLSVANTVDLTRKVVVDESYAQGQTDVLPDFDFSVIEDPGPQIPFFDNSSFGINFGIGVDYLDYTFEIRYMLSQVGIVDLIKINKRFHTLSFLVYF